MLKLPFPTKKSSICKRPKRVHPIYSSCFLRQETLLQSVSLHPRVFYSRPLPSSKNPHFQNETEWTTSLLKMSFICKRWKIISVLKIEQLTSFWYRGPGKLGNGLFIGVGEIDQCPLQVWRHRGGCGVQFSLLKKNRWAQLVGDLSLTCTAYK